MSEVGAVRGEAGGADGGRGGEDEDDEGKCGMNHANLMYYDVKFSSKSTSHP